MRVLHIINGEFYSGAERVQDLLAISMPEEGVEVHLACMKPKKFRAYCACSKELVHDFPMGSRFDISSVGRLVILARSLDARIIHTHTPRAALIGALVSLRTGLPRVHHVHSPTTSDTENKQRNFVNTFVERVSVLGTKRFIVVSRSIAEWMASLWIKKERIVVVPNGVPCLTNQHFRERNGTVVIGVVALFRPRKGLEVLLKAVQIILDKGCDVHLRVVGGFESQDYETHVKGLAENLGISNYVTWRGFRSDVSSELAEMDIFALTSLYGEGMPMVILEAMAACLPTVASRVEGIPEVIRDKQDGILVEPGDASDLVRGLLMLVDDACARATMGESAKRRHAQLYSDRAMAARVAEVYKHVLAS